MEDNRTTLGGVGTVLLGLALSAVALSAGWLSGSAYDGRIKGRTSAVLAESQQADSADAAPLERAPTPVPTPTAPAGFPYVSSRSFALLEGGCGALIYGRREHETLPPASLTKLMTAAVATDQADVGLLVTSNVSGSQLYDETGSTIMGLEPGMQLSLLDLLYGLLLPSGNDAAIAIAEAISGGEDEFAELMNAKAASLALDDSHFTNPHGLYEDGLYSSAYDMAVLARYVMQNATLRQIVSSLSWQPAWDGPEVWNGNRFVAEYPGADGVKIGYTEESQQTIVASAVRDERRIIASVMQSADRYYDAAQLLDWAFEQPSACP